MFPTSRGTDPKSRPTPSSRLGVWFPLPNCPTARRGIRTPYTGTSTVATTPGTPVRHGSTHGYRPDTVERGAPPGMFFVQAFFTPLLPRIRNRHPAARATRTDGIRRTVSSADPSNR